MARESQAAKIERGKEVVKRLKQTYPDVRCMLIFSSTHELMIAVMLSAQSTDERVNMVTPALFKKYRTVEAFAKARAEDIEAIIHSVGLSGGKASNIKQSAIELLERFGGEVPRTLGELVTLPGVGRKTASVILGVGFGLAEGVVVDTHVTRLSNLLGFTKQSDPLRIERDLVKIIGRDDWIVFSHLMIFHGRAICKARRPECGQCAVRRLCPSSLV